MSIVGKDRSDCSIEVEFTHPTTKETVKEDVYLPYDIYNEALEKFIDRKFDIIVDGKSSDIIHMLNFFDADFWNMEHDDIFLEICAELYNESYYKEEDYEDWLEDYNYLHDIEA